MAKNYYLIVDADQDCSGNLCICDNTGFGPDGFLRNDETNPNRYNLYEVGIFTRILYVASKETTVVFSDFKHILEADIETFNHNYTVIIDNKCTTLDKDGYYKIEYFAIPFEIKFTAPYSYYCDLEGNIFNDENLPVDINDLVFNYSNMMHFTTKYFSYNNLRNKYISAAYDKIYKNEKGVLNKINKGWCCDPKKSEQTFSQSIMGSALATIRYLLEACKYDEAQLIIEQLSNCGDIYINGTNNTVTTYGCGCGK